MIGLYVKNMAGYCIELYKYMRIDEDTRKKEKLIKDRRYIFEINEDSKKKDNKVNENDGNFLAYGEFDRIGIERIERFSRLRDVSERARVWIGDRQTVLLYEINKEKDKVVYKDKNFYCKSESKLQQSTHLFVGFTILQFKYSLKKQCENMEEFLSDCQEKILKLVESKFPDLVCSVLGMLGSFGLVIFWLADQYVDVLNAVTKIRNMNLDGTSMKEGSSAFLSAYTIFAQNHKTDNVMEQTERLDKIKKIEGDAILHITLKSGVNEAILKKIREACRMEDTEQFYHSAGEYDITVQMKSANAYLVFQENELLYTDSEFFQKYILQTSLQLCECLQGNKSEANEHDRTNEQQADKQKSNEQPDDEREVLPFLNKIQEQYSKLRKRFREKYPSTAGMVDTLDLLYSDYIAKISTASNEMWESNFSYQFYKILDCLNKFIKNQEKVSMSRESMLQTINELLGDFERQISHIAESNNLVLGTPTCQFRYSGNNNLTLYAYFEFIKETLDYVYSEQKVSNQAEIVPLIVGDTVPIIQSTLFIDYNNKEASRIITINLPMGALYNPVFYFPYLYHEIFHYVVPRDRYIRNEIVGMMMSMEVLNSIIKQIITDKIGLTQNERELVDLFINKYLLRYAYSFVIKRFEQDIDPSKKVLKDKEITIEKINEEVKDAEQYEKNLFLQWIYWVNEEENIQLNDNPIQEYFLYLYENEGNISKDLDDWFEHDIKQDKREFSKSNDIKSLIGNFRKITDNTDVKLVDAAFRDIMTSINNDILGNSLLLVKAVRELMADIAMIQLTGMEFTEYLLAFTKIDKDLTIDNTKKPEREVQDVIRIGAILEYYCRKKRGYRECIGDIKKGRQEFINMYCGLYYSTHKESPCSIRAELVQQAAEWFEYWTECYELYCYRYGLYSALLEKLCEQSLTADYKIDCKPVTNCWQKYISVLRCFGRDIDSDDMNETYLAEKRSVMDEKIFRINMSLIHNYQKQRTFAELENNRTKNIEEREKQEWKCLDVKYDKLSLSPNIHAIKPTSKKEYSWIYGVDSVGRLGTIILEIAEQLKRSNCKVLGNEDYPIWYRGHQSEKYQLLPSIMRKFKEYANKTSNPDGATLQMMLRKEYEEFKFRADGEYEIIDRIGYTDCDYIALMQHYSVASNFLDWTEDALSSLYFAVEEYMDEKVDEVDSNAALYIFSPGLYNNARLEMIKEAQKHDGLVRDIEKEIIKEMPKEIPNLTAPYNKGKHDVYMFGNDKYMGLNAKPLSEENIQTKAAYYTPMAIYSSRLNKRIQAQKGMFLAYNIYTPRSKEDEFNYIALENIQSDYLKNFKGDDKTCPFLYKLIIQKDKKEDVAKWIKAFGMSKERCYPELSSIGERIMRY